MSSFASPDARTGRLRPPPPGFPPEARELGYGRWLWKFITDELRPYPGRGAIVARMVISATLTMGVIMTFRLPGSALAVYYTLILARESPRATFRGALTILGAYLAGGLYSLLGIWLLIDYPLTHFLWVVVSLFLCFFLIKVMTNTVASGGFAFMITIVLPLWDTPLPTGTLMTGTLWATGSVTVGLVVTVLVEYLFAAFVSPDELLSGISQRLAALVQFLREEADGAVPDPAAHRTIAQLAMVGVSRLRRLANSESSSGGAARNSTVVSLVGRLIDLAASYPQLSPQLHEAEAPRMRVLAGRLERLRQQFDRRQPVDAEAFEAAAGEQQRLEHPGNDPLLLELEGTADLLFLSLSERQQPSAEPEEGVHGRARLFVADAFTNPEHLTYSLRGCLAASLCYILINAIAWRGLSTALATCVITALTSVGSSRQKQVLRLTGATVGALLFGLGTQVLVLPALDSIGGFAILFACVTAFSAWFSTASPRLSYFGLQVALAFYLINLQEFYPQTNLLIARDRVMGVLLGLVAMWLVYDTIGSIPATTVMLDLFATNLKLLAEAAEPWKNGRVLDLKRIRAVRDHVSANFAAVNAQADAVLFETGPQRHQHLWLRERLLAWQPRLRSIFLIQIALLQYRIHVHPEELSPAVLAAQTEFDGSVSDVLLRMQSRFEPSGAAAEPPSVLASTASISTAQLDAAHARLEAAVRHSSHAASSRAHGILALNAVLVQTLREISREVNSEPDLSANAA